MLRFPEGTKNLLKKKNPVWPHVGAWTPVIDLIMCEENWWATER